MITTIDPDTIEVDLDVLKRTNAELEGNMGAYCSVVEPGADRGRRHGRAHLERGADYCPAMAWDHEGLGALIAFAVATITTPAGVSGAVFLIPVQVSILGVPNPASTPTNLLYNVIATPGALLGYRSVRSRAGAGCWRRDGPRRDRRARSCG